MPLPIPLSDEDLVACVLSDPEEGMKVLLAQHGALIRTLIRRQGFSNEDCKEVYQEVSLRLIKDNLKLIKGWDPTRCPLRGYLAVITQSACLNFYRSSFHRYSREKATQDEVSWALEWAQSNTSTPLERLERHRLLERLARGLDALQGMGRFTEQDRLIFEFRIGGMTWEQIAESLGISCQTARNRMYRLKQALKKGMHRLAIPKGLD